MGDITRAVGLLAVGFVGKEPSPYLETVGWTDVSMASVIFDRSGPNLRIPGTHKL